MPATDPPSARVSQLGQAIADVLNLLGLTCNADEQLELRPSVERQRRRQEVRARLANRAADVRRLALGVEALVCRRWSAMPADLELRLLEEMETLIAQIGALAPVNGSGFKEMVQFLVTIQKSLRNLAESMRYDEDQACAMALDPEESALVRLAEAELWAVDELPEGIDEDMLRCLDARGWVEARNVLMVNSQPSGSGNFVPQRGEWVSPYRLDKRYGAWNVILRNTKRGRFGHPSEVRISEGGRVQLARIRRRLPKAALLEQTAKSSPASDSDGGDYRTAAWFDKATGGGLYADLLKMASRQPNARLGYRVVGRRRQYRISEVVLVWPEYRSTIENYRKQTETNGNGRKNSAD